MQLQVKVTGYYVLGWRSHQFITYLCTRYLVHVRIAFLVQLSKCIDVAYVTTANENYGS